MQYIDVQWEWVNLDVFVQNQVTLSLDNKIKLTNMWKKVINTNEDVVEQKTFDLPTWRPNRAWQEKWYWLWRGELSLANTNSVVSKGLPLINRHTSSPSPPKKNNINIKEGGEWVPRERESERARKDRRESSHDCHRWRMVVVGLSLRVSSDLSLGPRFEIELKQFLAFLEGFPTIITTVQTYQQLDATTNCTNRTTL